MVCELSLNKAVFSFKKKKPYIKKGKKLPEVGNQQTASIISAEAIWSQDDVST